MAAKDGPRDLFVTMYQIAQSWEFTDDKYPELRGLSAEQRRIFALRHILLHQMGTLGELAKLLEQAEHGKSPFKPFEVDPRMVEIGRKMTFNSLRFADLANDSATELEEWLRKKDK